MARPPSPTGSDGRIPVVTLVDGLGRHGGAEHLALSIATRLDPERFDSTLCVSRWPPPADEVPPEAALEALAQAGVRFLPLGRRRKTDVWVWRRLAGFLRRHHVQVLHAHKFGSNVWGTAVGRAAGVPVVLAHEHTWSYTGQPLRRLLDRELVARGADRFIAVSREDQRRMVAVERIPIERTLFLPNGVPATAAPSGNDVRRELDLAVDAPVIGSVGSLRPQKAYDVLLHAAARLRSDWPDLAVLVVGGGSEQARLEALRRELGLEQAVHLLGFRGDVPDVLRALDVAICSSDFEGSPLSVLEYMDAGLGIVATAVGGVPDLIDDGVHGLLVAPRDPDALARAVDALLRDPERRRRLGEQARERRRAEFGIETMVHRIEELYEQLLAERRRRT